MLIPNFHHPRGDGQIRLPHAAEMDVGPISAFSPPELFGKLRRLFADRLRKPARSRVGQQAMIVTPVRIQHLIALLPRHPSHARHGSNSLSGRLGLFEDDPQSMHNGTRRWRGSAHGAPQHYGKNTPVLFDVEGLIDWLRRRYPRSTINNVAADTGIVAASVENWLHRRSQPSVEHFMILLTAYGPEMLHACLRHAPGWIEHAATEQRRREIDAQIARLSNERLALA